jgi:hypothetical protein
MLEKLINDGKALESEVKEEMGLKVLDSINFEKWAAAGVLYLEKKHLNSVLTEKAKEQFKTVTYNTSYDLYKYLLGALEATKEYEDDQKLQFEKMEF